MSEVTGKCPFTENPVKIINGKCKCDSTGMCEGEIFAETNQLPEELQTSTPKVTVKPDPTAVIHTTENHHIVFRAAAATSTTQSHRSNGRPRY